MKIGITPSVKETYKNQFEYCIDIKLVNFVRYCFKNSEIVIINDKFINCKNFDLLIISGGNDLYHLKKKKKNLIRNNLERRIIKNALRSKTTVLGICYGAQFLSNKFGVKVFKVKGYVGKVQKINFTKKLVPHLNTVNVRCYHNYAIKKNNKLEQIAVFKNKTLAFFKIKKKNVFGIMWHPERDIQFKKFNKLIIKKICN